MKMFHFYGKDLNCAAYMLVLVNNEGKLDINNLCDAFKLLAISSISLIKCDSQKFGQHHKITITARCHAMVL